MYSFKLMFESFSITANFTENELPNLQLFPVCNHVLRIVLVHHTSRGSTRTAHHFKKMVLHDVFSTTVGQSENTLADRR